MGSSSSKNRKITIDNHNPASVIKVSDECVERLKGYRGSGVSISNKEVPQQTVEQQPIFYEPSLTSIQLRQAQVRALQDNDKYWDKRIECLQKGHQEISKIMEEEYQKAIKEVSETGKNDYNRCFNTAPCVDRRTKIIDCYKKHKHEPIRCAKEVQEFSECVDKSTLIVATQ